jgi:hypothetical protein
VTEPPAAHDPHELRTRLRGAAQPRLLVIAGVLPLHDDLERQAVGQRNAGGRVATGRCDGLERLADDVEGAERRRARVVARELTHLPLTRQEPQRIPQASLHAVGDVRGARDRLEPVPRRD